MAKKKVKSNLDEITSLINEYNNTKEELKDLNKLAKSLVELDIDADVYTNLRIEAGDFRDLANLASQNASTLTINEVMNRISNKLNDLYIDLNKHSVKRTTSIEILNLLLRDKKALKASIKKKLKSHGINY